MQVFNNQKYVVSIVYVVTMFIVAMDGTIVNVALPAIGADFHIPPAATSAVNVGYLVSLAITLPISGWLGDRWGTKRVFLVALFVFTLASALCGLADRLSLLNGFRMLQGAAGGVLTPICMAMLFRTFSKEERPKIARSLVLPIAVAPAVGPVIGGILVDQLSWHWIFYINIPIGLAVWIFGLICLMEYKREATGPLDVLGLLLSIPGFALFMYALNQGPFQGWQTNRILFSGIVGLVLVTFFILVEWRKSQPLLELRLLKDRLFRTMALTASLSVGGLLGVLYVLPLMFQNVVGLSAMESGLAIFPEALGLMLASRMMAWTSKRISIRNMMVLGLIGTMLIFGLLSIFAATEHVWIIRFLLFGVGLCLGHTVVAAQFTAFNHVEAPAMGQATTLYNVQNRIGSAMGVAVLASLLGILENGTLIKSTSAYLPYQAAILGAVILLLLALTTALRLQPIITKKTLLSKQESDQPMDKVIGE